MRIERINEDKIKVLMDSDEAKAWQVSSCQLSANTPQIQKLFRTVIHYAEANIDFSVSGAKLFVEALKEEEGFGMLITCVRNSDQLKDAVDRCSYQGRIKRTVLHRAEDVEIRRIYQFSDFEAVCHAAEQVCKLFEGESALYKCDGAFYLYLSGKNPDNFRDTEAVLLEFGTGVKNGRYMHGRLNEYGEKMIAKEALCVMQEYFCVK